MRIYPVPANSPGLYSGITGYQSPVYPEGAGIEAAYNKDLSLHAQPARTLGQLLTPPPPTADDVTLTLDPKLQSTAAAALASDAQGQDAAVVALDPRSGAIRAMYSVPNYDPNAIVQPDVQKAEAAYTSYATRDAEGFAPIQPMASYDTIAPGSTFKVVTTTAAYNLDPSLAASFFFPPAVSIVLPGTKGQMLNNSEPTPCGGHLADVLMLPASCDPGYATLGMDLGGQVLWQQANLFGFNARPPVDLSDSFVSASYFPPPSAFSSLNEGLAGLAKSAIGQQDVTVTALQNALVAAGIADNGTVMTPHLMAQVRDAQGNLVTAYQPKTWMQACSPSVASQVNNLMQQVVSNPQGTAYGHLDPSLDAAAKTGTAQTGANLSGTGQTNDWMIAFAPANNPKVAVAVVVPHQGTNDYGATIAGPVMNTMLTAAEQGQ